MREGAPKDCKDVMWHLVSETRSWCPQNWGNHWVYIQMGGNKDRYHRLTPRERVAEALMLIIAGWHLTMYSLNRMPKTECTFDTGSDSGSSVLRNVFYNLLTHPASYDRLRMEINNAFPAGVAPTDSSILAALPFLNAVMCVAFYIPRFLCTLGFMC